MSNENEHKIEENKSYKDWYCGGVWRWGENYKWQDDWYSCSILIWSKNYKWYEIGICRFDNSNDGFYRNMTTGESAQYDDCYWHFLERRLDLKPCSEPSLTKQLKDYSDKERIEILKAFKKDYLFQREEYFNQNGCYPIDCCDNYIVKVKKMNGL